MAGDAAGKGKSRASEIRSSTVLENIWKKFEGRLANINHKKELIEYPVE